MRLINTATLELEEFNASQDRPDYAILSHRWVHGEEVTFNDIKGTHRRWMPGWSKIRFCCRQAIQDGLTHAWVDTCCIDKDSSAELSEAINSMYEWYASATVCYAYLNDVIAGETESLWTRIANSSWFTRAWNLQELLAPVHVVFYDQHFNRLASKHDVAKHAQSLIRIPAKVLNDPQNILLYPVAVRMSWAAHREATRVEDVAYSLFGIFQVNLPLLYGEGDRAFVRLQEEIIKHSHDHSIFAWTAKDIKPVRLGASNVLPLLAPSLARFEDCSDVSTMEEDHEIRAYTMTNIGLEIELLVTPYDLNVYAALLDCRPGPVWTRYAILLARESTKTSRFYRVTVNGQSLVEVRDMTNFQWQKMHIVRSPDIEYRRKKNLAGGEKDQLHTQLYGIRVQAPEFLRRDDTVRPYTLVAHHDWEDGGRRLQIVKAEKLPQNKHSSRSISKLSPLANINLTLSGLETANSLDLSHALNHVLGRNDASAPFRAAQIQTSNSNQAENGRQTAHTTIQGSQARAVVYPTELSISQDILTPAENARSTQHPTHSYSAIPMKPFGSLEMPLMSTGTAGVIYFDQPLHGIKSIKAGFDFDFVPVVFFATDEADTDLEIQRWTQQTRYVELRTFEQSHYLLDDFHEEGARHFWKLHPDTLRNRKDLDISHEGVIRVNKGVYAFKPKDVSKHEHWIFKPHESQNWHLVVELYKVERDQEAFWELNIGWHEEHLEITVQII